jgi:hypothetical protein
MTTINLKAKKQVSIYSPTPKVGELCLVSNINLDENSNAGRWAASSSTCLVAVAAASYPSAAGALSARGAPRPVRRRSEAFGEGGRRLGDGVIDPDRVGPSADRGRPVRGRLRASSLRDRSTWGDCRQCPLTAVVQRAGVSESYSASVANRSIPLARLAARGNDIRGTTDFGSRGGKATARRLFAGADERAGEPKR